MLINLEKRKKENASSRDLQSVIFDKISNSWIAPFVMAGINTKLVRRSHALIDFKYGSDFSYDEATFSGKGVLGQVKGYLSLIPIFLATRKKGSFIKNIVDYLVRMNRIILNATAIGSNPDGIGIYCRNIIESSKTVLWNGPAGYFENPSFANGSDEIANKIIEKNKKKLIYSIVGGGDTIAVLNQINAINYFDFVSTAGGAFLEYLEGKELPGIKALN